MIEICNYSECTGCYSCANVCSFHCITMEQDKYGELHPVINQYECTNCGACIKACPNNNMNLNFNYPTKAYASWNSIYDEIKTCASGGIATLISKYVILKNSGIVYGTKYDNQVIPVTDAADDIDGIESFKGSKYVQSLVGQKTFKDILSYLRSDIQVVYIGTPCQVAGLKTFLKRDYDNLICVDLICHGVSPMSYFKDEISYLANRYKINKITDVRFRGNDSCNFIMSIWNGCSLVKKIEYWSYYLDGFLQNITLRENCYSCKYARPERVSDITIGDYILVGKPYPFERPPVNVSSVFINTQKGESFYKEIMQNYPELINIERPYEERLQYAPSLKEPCQRNPLSFKFRRLYLQYGYCKAIRKTLFRQELNKYIRRKVKKSLKSILMYRAR